MSALLCAFLLLPLVLSSPASALASPNSTSLFGPQSEVLSTFSGSYAYAAYATGDSYDVMLADGSGNDRRVARIKVDGIYFSDAAALLSNDGTKIAFRVSGDRLGGSSLYVLDVKSGKYDQIASTRSTAESIGSFMWSPTGSTLAFVRSSPAPYPADVDSAYGSIFVYLPGRGAVRLGGTHGNEKVAGFSSDGKGVYVSRRESLVNVALEHLVYLPLSGGDGVTLIRSQVGLRYSHFAVWSQPGSPAKVAAIAEGNFALALAPTLPASETITPSQEGPTATSTAISTATSPPPTATEVPPTETSTQQPTVEATAEGGGTTTLVPTATSHPTQQPESVPTQTRTQLPAPAEETPTPAGPEPAATEAQALATPMVSSAIKVSSLSRLYGPSGYGIVVSDPAGTMPTLLRRDAEAYEYMEWTRDGTGILAGGTGSGAAWGIGLDGNRHAMGVPLTNLHTLGWVGARSVVLANYPATRVVTLDFDSGSAVSTRSVGAYVQPAAAALRLAVPYIHQVNDTRSDGNGNWACGPTSIAMVLGYYGRLEPWKVYVAEEQAEAGQPIIIPNVDPRSVSGSDFAPYISNAYTAYGRTYNALASDPSGNRLAGLYGTICPTGYASWQAMVSVLESHGLGTQYVAVTWDGVVGALKRGHPVVLGNDLTAAGHILVVIGYTPDGNLVVNDPYGNRFEPGYGGNNGRGILYAWKRVTPRRALEVIGTYPPPVRPTRTPRPATPTPTYTPVPTTEPTATAAPETPTPMPGYSTPDLPPTVTPEASVEPTPDPLNQPTLEPAPTPEETPAPTPTFNVSNLLLQVPLLLAAIGFALVRRRGE